MSKKTRSRQHRRDRRKAKASGWARPGKQQMGARVGHGAGAGARSHRSTPASRPLLPEVAPERPPVRFGATHRPFEVLGKP